MLVLEAFFTLNRFQLQNWVNRVPLTNLVTTRVVAVNRQNACISLEINVRLSDNGRGDSATKEKGHFYVREY